MARKAARKVARKAAEGRGKVHKAADKGALGEGDSSYMRAFL